MAVEQDYLIFILGGVGITCYILGRISRNGDLEDAERKAEGLRKQYSEVLDRLREVTDGFKMLKEEYNESERRLKILKVFLRNTLKDWKQQEVLLPSLREWSNRIQLEYDEMIQRDFKQRRPPAWKAAQHVKEARAKAREYKKEVELLKPQLILYESLAPWLSEYVDLTVEEILEGIKEESQIKKFYKSGDDPISLFVPKSEWKNLSEIERNQLALDRYWNGNRRRSAWTAGIQYERYIGYKYEQEGYDVKYQGATMGVDDLGIDLICSKDNVVLIVQCKRLSKLKGIPVRENVIAQIYGAARYYAMKNPQIGIVKPVLYTSFECSDTARKFAEYLEVQTFENVSFKPYPCIKCNISHLNNERIYHLPFDQQYDATVIGDMKGEFYAMTVNEAEKAGFRRAFRWMGVS